MSDHISHTSDDWCGHVQEMIRQHQIQAVRVCVQDLTNIARSRYVTARQFLDHLETGGLSFPSALFGLNASAQFVPGGGGSDFREGFPSWVWQPDLRTFSVLPYANGVARVIADVFQTTGQPVTYAPRHVLRRVLRRFDEKGWHVRGSYEYEFYVFRPTDHGWVPAWNGLQCFSEIQQAELEPLVLAIVRALQELGAGPEIANTEYGSGQFEVSNAPFWDIEIADMAFYYRTSIREVVAQAGFRACFMSKPRSNMSGSGAHLHHTLYDSDGRNLFWDPEQPDELSELCRWFIGGQLHHAASLTALACGTVNSYKRLQPYTFAPATVSWGYEHRGAMIRVPRHRGQNTRLENRLPGADTDPYLSLAGILAAGLDGIEKQLEPPPPVQGTDAYADTLPSLPRTMEEGLRILHDDPWLREVLGHETVEALWMLRSSDYEQFLRHVTDWELDTYQDLF